MKNIHQLITETVPVFFFTFNMKTRKVEYVSPQFFDYVHNQEKLKDLDPHDKLKAVIKKEDQPEFEKIFNDLGKEDKYEVSVELKASPEAVDIVWFEINTFHPTKASGNTLLVGHILDISLKKKYQENLKKENESIENILNMMAHDLKAPLANVSLIAGYLEAVMTNGDKEKYQKYLDMLKMTSKDSGKLIDRLLDLATFKGETSKLDLEIHDLRKTVKKVVTESNEVISERNFTITYNFPDSVVNALLDETLFKQVIQNLLTNAIKFTPDGGKITFTLAYTDDKKICLSIKDDGIGIPEEYLENLFEGISELKRKGLYGEKSTGLGLYISRQIINIHKGSISAASHKEQGSTFNIYLPVPKPSATYF